MTPMVSLVSMPNPSMAESPLGFGEGINECAMFSAALDSASLAESGHSNCDENSRAGRRPCAPELPYDEYGRAYGRVYVWGDMVMSYVYTTAVLLRPTPEQRKHVHRRSYGHELSLITNSISGPHNVNDPFRSAFVTLPTPQAQAQPNVPVRIDRTGAFQLSCTTYS